MEPAAETGAQGHPHVHAELSVGFILRVAGERFANNSRKRIQTVEPLPELFIPDAALPLTSRGTVSKRLPPQAPTLCSRPLTAGKAGRGNERFLGTSCSPSWHCATVFPKIVIKILSQPCYMGTVFVMLMLQTRRQAQKSAGPTVANQGQGRDVNPGPKASAPTGTTHGAGDRPGPASCPVLYVSDVGDSGERGTEWRQRREGRDACGAAQGLLIEGRCWSVLPSSCLWAVTS